MSQADLDRVEAAEVQFSDLPELTGLKLSDISCEIYREYDFGDRVYRITGPVALYLRPGGSTHRIVDIYGVSHCVAFPGEHTVLRWMNYDQDRPVNF